MLSKIGGGVRKKSKEQLKNGFLVFLKFVSLLPEKTWYVSGMNSMLQKVSHHHSMDLEKKSLQRLFQTDYK